MMARQERCGLLMSTGQHCRDATAVAGSTGTGEPA
jgi:hypothetical protein